MISPRKITNLVFNGRLGVHVNHEYSVDPLEVLFVGDVMSLGTTMNGGEARPEPPAGDAPTVGE